MMGRLASPYSETMNSHVTRGRAHSSARGFCGKSRKISGMNPIHRENRRPAMLGAREKVLFKYGGLPRLASTPWLPVEEEPASMSWKNK